VKAFYEFHDPTQGMRQGNDVGTQYRSAIYTLSEEQAQVAKEVTAAYEPELLKRGYGPITTEIKLAPTYYYAEDYHQQYLAKKRKWLPLSLSDRRAVPRARLARRPCRITPCGWGTPTRPSTSSSGLSVKSAAFSAPTATCATDKDSIDLRNGGTRFALPEWVEGETQFRNQLHFLIVALRQVLRGRDLMDHSGFERCPPSIKPL